MFVMNSDVLRISERGCQGGGTYNIVQLVVLHRQPSRTITGGVYRKRTI